MIRTWLTAIIASLVTTVSAPAAAQERASVIPGPAYRIHPGDELEIMVWGEERLHRSVRVLPDGTIAFPLVGQMMAQGQLPPDLERVITASLGPQYRGAVPQVTVMVTNPAGYQFSVVGKVRSPGTFTPGRYVNALEAVSIAGGPTEFAQLGSVSILRNTGTQMQTIPVKLNRALSGGAAAVSQWDIPPVDGGDTIVVP